MTQEEIICTMYRVFEIDQLVAHKACEAWVRDNIQTLRQWEAEDHARWKEEYDPEINLFPYEEPVEMSEEQLIVWFEDFIMGRVCILSEIAEGSKGDIHLAHYWEDYIHYDADGPFKQLAEKLYAEAEKRYAESK